MRLSHFFISRPIFAIVLSLFITIVGAVAYFTLPVAQYPEVAPPTIQVVRDIGRVELGALDYGANGYKDHGRSVPTLIYRQPGSNELTTAREIRKTMAQLAKDFPPGAAYENQYDATVFITQSVH
jgi:multidrug efflux pump subunit AcrB